MKKAPSKTDCPSFDFDVSLSAAVLNTLTAHIAILDENGIILQTNRAWQTFAAAGNATTPLDFTGINYLAVCDATQGEEAEDARIAAAGIRSIIRGEQREFLHAYPCHSPTEPHWFYMRAVRMAHGGAIRVVVSHEEVTRLKLAEEALQTSARTLKEQKQNLEEANIALKVLLRQREADKHEMEEKILANIEEIVLPGIEKLKRAPLRKPDKTMLEILEGHIKNIVSPMLQRMSNLNIVLTPQEMQIASLVKAGKGSKEIAQLLGLSDATVHFHRKNLRRKLGLSGTEGNLRTHLMSLENR
jgi:DNA-binding CsgD family transcriptional regulator